MEPFALSDCSLARCPTRRSCLNLRELLAALRTVPDAVLEHHMLRCPLEDHFELHEFPNDLAQWCWNALGDHALGEQLGLIDPYRHGSLTALRAELAEVVENRLWEQDAGLSGQPGQELHWLTSRLIVCDTGQRLATPMALAESLGTMSSRSLFFHVHEARRRTGGQSDDFSLWLEHFDVPPSLILEIRSIDFYFLNLSQLRRELIRVFQRNLVQPALAE